MRRRDSHRLRRYRGAALAGWLLSLAVPFSAQAWFNGDWPSRRQLAVDGSITGADLIETVSDFPLLIRLHGGNFGFFGELAPDGHDLRFLSDDQSPLKHQIEKFDPVNELGLVWVKLPTAGSGDTPFWMYYGNPGAPPGADSAGIYDAKQALVFHFAEGEALPVDATPYRNQAVASAATVEPAGWIGAAARFDGRGPVQVAAAPSLAVTDGLTFSCWLRIEQPGEGIVFRAEEGATALDLGLRGTTLSARLLGESQPALAASVNLQPGRWHHVATVLGGGRLTLYLDGNPAAEVAVAPVAFTPALSFGGAAGAPSFSGLLDEVQVATTARSADWIKLSYRSQSPDFAVLGHGPDESVGSAAGPSYFLIILQNLTLDGWMVIALCGLMLLTSLLVMTFKALLLRRALRENREFLARYHGLGSGADPTSLDRDETAEDAEAGASEVLAAIAGSHHYFQGSPIYHVYHAGVQELNKRIRQGGIRPLTPEALAVLRARLDSAVVREAQKLNRNMVLLTIAIAGGPFLGLLGTVLGVMITFAVIAATGDVNINTIAPGISGALLATVAGLAVAIPSLFGYNYLLTRIKDITADMRVFTDEFTTAVAERMADRGAAQPYRSEGRIRVEVSSWTTTIPAPPLAAQPRADASGSAKGAAAGGRA